MDGLTESIGSLTTQSDSAENTGSRSTQSDSAESNSSRSAQGDSDADRLEVFREAAKDGVQISTVLVIWKSTIPEGGLGMFTKQKIAAGEEILRIDAPKFCVAKQGVCDNCLWSLKSTFDNAGHFRTTGGPNDIEKLKRCGGCRRVAYCSRKCHVAAWKKHHKFECKSLKNLKGLDLEEQLLLTLRILCLHVGGQISEPMWAAISSLESKTDWHNRTYGLSDREGLVQIKSVSGSTLSQEEVKELYYRILRNCLTMFAAEGHETGHIIHPFVALANHSCDPNMFWFSDGAGFRLRSAKDIPESGELTISYIQPTYNFTHRQTQLKQRYGFACTCPRCKFEQPLRVFARRVPINSHKDEDCDPDGMKFEFLPGVDEAQQKMLDVCGEILHNDEFTLCENLEAMDNAIFEIASHAVPGRSWPENLEPVPSLYASLIEFHMLSGGDIVESLRYALQTCFIHDPITFGTPVDFQKTKHQFWFLRVLNSISGALQAPVGFLSDKLKELKPLEDAINLMKFNCHSRLAFAARKVWGADCMVTLAMDDLFVRQYGNTGAPGLNAAWRFQGTEESRKEEVEEAEKKVLDWSGIHDPARWPEDPVLDLD